MKRFRDFIQDTLEAINPLSSLDQLNIKLVLNKNIIWRSIPILGTFGYGIILMTLVDLTYAILPSKAQNPIWELNTINLMMGQVWFLFVGLALILANYLISYFSSKDGEIRVIEIFFFKVMRWIVLFLSVVCFLLTPLIILDTNRVNAINAGQVDQVFADKASQTDQMISRVENLTDIGVLKQLTSLPDLKNIETKGLSADQIKANIQQYLVGVKDNLKTESERMKKSKWIEVFKNSSRSAIAAIISAIALLTFFLRTNRLITD
jgi:hypothetical protein